MTNIDKAWCVIFVVFIAFIFRVSLNGPVPKSEPMPTTHVIKIVIEVKTDDPSGPIGEALPVFPLEHKDIL